MVDLNLTMSIITLNGNDLCTCLFLTEGKLLVAKAVS